MVPWAIRAIPAVVATAEVPPVSGASIRPPKDSSTSEFPYRPNKRQGRACQSAAMKGQTIPIVNAVACYIVITALRETKGHVVIYSTDSSSSPIEKVSLDFTRKTLFRIQGIEEMPIVFASFVCVY